MEIVYVLQVVTICITAITLIVNVLVTFVTGRQDNYNKIITNSRLEFMTRNRDNAAQFAAEAKNIVLMLKCGAKTVNIKPLYVAFEQIRISLKPYNTIDKKIIDEASTVVSLVEQSIVDNSVSDNLMDSIDEFIHLINIYDDADWKFIKQQFNSTKKKSADFDKICDEIISKYQK